MVEMIDSKLVAGNGTRTINNGGGSIFVFLFQPWVGIIVLLVTVYTIGKYRYQWKDSDVEYTYKSAWVKGELWRTGLASISHSDVLHLVYSLLGVLWTGIANRGKVCVFLKCITLKLIIYMPASLLNISVQV